MTSNFAKFVKDFKNKKILIMGLGLLGKGIGDAIFFSKIGASVTVTDLKNLHELKDSVNQLNKYPIKYVLGKHRKIDFINSDVVIRNPGVPINSPYLAFAKKLKKQIEMDDSLFAKYAPCKIIGVTGTRGKSTTATLIYEILKKAKIKAVLGGNIQGIATLPFLENVTKKHIAVLELSSWQLQGFDDAKISPHISVITSIFEDHLDRYKSKKDYLKDKKVILKYQTKKDFAVLNKNFSEIIKLAKNCKAKKIWVKGKFTQKILLKLPGEHNQQNAQISLEVAEILKIKKSIALSAVKNFKGLNYRLEKIANIDRVEFINDSTSTTPAAGLAALSSFLRPIILIAGGNSKNLDMEKFAKKIAEKTKAVLFLPGSETKNLIQLVKKFQGGNKIKGEFSTIKKALIKAKSLAIKGDIILFSPGCTSFKTFINEFDRGEKFNEAVFSLQKKEKDK